MSLKVIWGNIITFDGCQYKDCKLKGKNSYNWNWSEFDTHHKPGIQINDVKSIIDNNTQIIILSKGFDNVLKTMQETLDYLKELNIKIYHLNTKDAVIKYNELVNEYDNKLVALIHSTC